MYVECGLLSAVFLPAEFRERLGTRVRSAAGGGMLTERSSVSHRERPSVSSGRRQGASYPPLLPCLRPTRHVLCPKYLPVLRRPGRSGRTAGGSSACLRRRRRPAGCGYRERDNTGTWRTWGWCGLGGAADRTPAEVCIHSGTGRRRRHRPYRRHRDLPAFLPVWRDLVCLGWSDEVLHRLPTDRPAGRGALRRPDEK